MVNLEVYTLTITQTKPGNTVDSVICYTEKELRKENFHFYFYGRNSKCF